ncbi:MAG: ATP-binding protein [Acidobacteriota bacterium]
MIKRLSERLKDLDQRERAVRRAERELSSRLEDYRSEAQRGRAQAEAGIRAKREFLASISHELRTPLGGILGFGDLLLKTDLTAEQRQMVHCMQSGADELRVMIDDLLEFSRAEADRLENVNTAEIDPRRLITEAIESWTCHAKEKNLKLSSNVDRAVPLRIRQDADRLRQLLGYLAGNAVKFTSSGGVSIKVTKTHSDEPRLRFTVQDTGVGIPDQALSTVFEPLSQVDSSDSRRFGGMGMGLAISQRIVEKLGGSIGATSTLGVGSSFWFDIPFEQVAERAELGAA